MAATPAQLGATNAAPLFAGVPAAIEYVAELLDQAPDILSRSVSKALAEEVDYVRGRAAYTEHAVLARQFDIRAEGVDTFVYGFAAEHGVRDPKGRFMSWKTMEYGEQGQPATGFLRSAVVNRERKLSTRITQLITEDLG